MSTSPGDSGSAKRAQKDPDAMGMYEDDVRAQRPSEVLPGGSIGSVLIDVGF